MTTIREGRSTHVFPQTWRAKKYDALPYYVNHAQSFASGLKAVDIAAIEPGNSPVLWLVELKDYRLQKRTKPSDLFDEVAQKVRDTLAGLKIISTRSNDVTEAEFAQLACSARSIKVMLHLEQPNRHSKLFPQIIDPKIAKQAMKSKMRAVDAHPIIGNAATLDSKVTWTIT